MLQQSLSKNCYDKKHVIIQVLTSFYVSKKLCFHSPSPESSNDRLCVSLPSHISKVYLPLSFSVGLEISIQTFCRLLPGLVLASWSILFSLPDKKKGWFAEKTVTLLVDLWRIYYNNNKSIAIRLLLPTWCYFTFSWNKTFSSAGDSKLIGFCETFIYQNIHFYLK